MDYIEGRRAIAREAFLERFAQRPSPHFDPDVHLQAHRRGQPDHDARARVAGDRRGGGAGDGARYGAEHRAAHFRTFDTICSATQDRQDAVNEMLHEPLDVMVVVGGYNSSNTISLAALCAEKVRTYPRRGRGVHRSGDGAVRIAIRRRAKEVATAGWLPMSGPVRVGLTAGASTPNNKIGETVARVVRPDGAVEARYEALTTGRARLPFLWSAMLRFPLTPQSRLSLPVGARLRVAASRGLLERGRTPTPAVDSRWPHMALAGRTHDLSDPWDLPRRTHLSAWLDLGPGRALLKVRQGDEHLTIACDGEAVPYLGLVIDRGGRDTPVGPRLPFARQGTPTLTLRPSLGAPDRYPEALGDWQSIRWLEPGQPRRWTLTIRGGV
jgi:hypothetical protein